MIDSIINRHRKVIHLDRCMDGSTCNKGLLTDPNDVINKTNRHFQRVTGTSHHSETIPYEWLKQYQPVDHIDPLIYANLMTLPSEEEQNDIINALPTNKAPGPSKIANEMLQNLGPQTKWIFWIFICGCLSIPTLPDAWNVAFIYPVPKPKPWEYDLNNTRPITLLECPRKALVKLINNRLLNILSTHHALKGYNFAGLPHRSTKDPIYILDHIKNDAQFHCNHLWILF